jgi:succinate dehydrogenase / fumarate reductase cytochrome b subunit
MNKQRPKYLTLYQIRLPLSGVVSILHRISGVMLFLALPLMLFMLQSSLRSIETYTRLMTFFSLPLIKLGMLGLLWAFLHHFCAGLRFLAVDCGHGLEREQARASSKAVLGASLLLTLLLGVTLW